MSTSPQLGSTDVLVGTFHNFSTTTDIAAGLGVLADTSHLPSTDFAGGIILPANSGGVVGTLGVTMEKIPAGRTGRVRLSGVSVCTAEGSVTYGTPVQISDTSGKNGWVKTCGATTVQLGIAIDPSGGDGELVRVVHTVSKNG